jgi:ankyrin repeat protein
LHQAAYDGDVELVALLLELGADPARRDHSFNATPLGWAEHNHQQAAVELLRSGHAPPTPTRRRAQPAPTRTHPEAARARSRPTPHPAVSRRPLPRHRRVAVVGVATRRHGFGD